MCIWIGCRMVTQRDVMASKYDLLSEIYWLGSSRSSIWTTVSQCTMSWTIAIHQTGKCHQFPCVLWISTSNNFHREWRYTEIMHFFFSPFSRIVCWRCFSRVFLFVVLFKFCIFFVVRCCCCLLSVMFFFITLFLRFVWFFFWCVYFDSATLRLG